MFQRDTSSVEQAKELKTRSIDSVFRHFFLVTSRNIADAESTRQSLLNLFMSWSHDRRKTISTSVCRFD